MIRLADGQKVALLRSIDLSVPSGDWRKSLANPSATLMPPPASKKQRNVREHRIRPFWPWPLCK
jgi:hypothetical protein